MIRLSIIVAATSKNGIGKNGTLPWHIHEDMKYFAHVTKQAPEGTYNAVIMGRKTWESIPKKNRPLPGRVNIVISNDSNYALDIADNSGHGVVVTSLHEALDVTHQMDVTRKTPIHRSFIIGGASLYEKTLNPDPADDLKVDHVLVTRVTNPEYDCDVEMPEFRDYGKWKRTTHEELSKWVGDGYQIPEGVQKQADGTQYEFQMWVPDE